MSLLWKRTHLSFIVLAEMDVRCVVFNGHVICVGGTTVSLPGTNLHAEPAGIEFINQFHHHILPTSLQPQNLPNGNQLLENISEAIKFV